MVECLLTSNKNFQFLCGFEEPDSVKYASGGGFSSFNSFADSRHGPGSPAKPAAKPHFQFLCGFELHL